MHDLSFADRIRTCARLHSSRVVLALDLRGSIAQLQSCSVNLIDGLSSSLAAVKINFHLLLPLSLREIAKINSEAHSRGLQTIADIKLNDIASTNETTVSILWEAGFDAVIANPFVGYQGALDAVFPSAHRENKGIILLVYMSHPAAAQGYGLSISDPRRTIFEDFVDRAVEWKADGVVVGATQPDKIATVRKKIPRQMLIFSPGVGAQGGQVKKSLDAGSDFLIVGRSVIESSDPAKMAKRICQESWLPFSP